MTDDNSIPAPMLPEGVEPHEFDLQNFPTMPFDVSAFRDSEIQTTLSSEGLVAALNLWCGSWHQVPAGSLPNNPALLAKIAGYGKSLKAFQAPSSTNPDKTIMEEALYGFKLCSDGRWWHPVVAKHAREAYSYKVRRKNQTSKATQARQDRAKGKAHDNHDNFDAPAGVMNCHDDTGNDTLMTDSVMTNGQSGDVMTTETRADTSVSRNVDRDVNVTFTNRTERNGKEKKEESPLTPQGGGEGELFGSGTDAGKAKKPVLWDGCTAEDWFETFRKSYPRRNTQHTWSGPRGGKVRFLQAVKDGVDPRIMVAAAQRYAAEMLAAGNVNERAQFIKDALTWLNGKMWEQYSNIHRFPTAGAGKTDAPEFEEDFEPAWKTNPRAYTDTRHPPPWEDAPVGQICGKWRRGSRQWVKVG